MTVEGSAEAAEVSAETVMGVDDSDPTTVAGSVNTESNTSSAPRTNVNHAIARRHSRRYA